jgi:hypothetical protein
MRALNIAIALDRGILGRLQSAYDRLWDGFGVTVGDLACAYTVVVMGSAIAMANGSTLRICLLIGLGNIALGAWLAAHQRNGRYKGANENASDKAAYGLGMRLGGAAFAMWSLAMFVAGQGTASGFLCDGFLHVCVLAHDPP